MTFERPADIIDGGLRYQWLTNASPEAVTQSGKTVTLSFKSYDGPTSDPKVYDDARVGPPTKHDPTGVGIYVRTP